MKTTKEFNLYWRKAEPDLGTDMPIWLARRIEKIAFNAWKASRRYLTNPTTNERKS